MISVIVCYTSEELFKNLVKSIADSISVDYEIVAMDNREKSIPITKVYNMLARKAKFPVLIFLHQDVVFHHIGWGVLVLNLLEDNSIGLAGLSGNIYKSRFPSTWSMTPQYLYRSHAIQHLSDNSSKLYNTFKNDSPFAEVTVIDGFFMALQKKVWENYHFNETDITGFHFYDYDYALKVSQHYRVVVVNGISAEHQSLGTIDREWIRDALKWHKLNRKDLPLIAKVPGLSRKEQIEADYHSCSSFTISLMRNRYSIKTILYYLISCMIIKPFHPFNRRLLGVLFKEYLNNKPALEL